MKSIYGARACGNPLLWYNVRRRILNGRRARACGNPLLWYNPQAILGRLGNS